MKKFANLLALLVMVNVNVLTSLVYANENQWELPEVAEEVVTNFSVEENLEVVEPENLVEKSDDVESIVEDTMSTDMITRIVNDLEEENEQELVENSVVEKVVNKNEEEIDEEGKWQDVWKEVVKTTRIQQPLVTTITYDAEKWIIKLNKGTDEIRVKDKNVWATGTVFNENLYQLRLLMNKMCYRKESFIGPVISGLGSSYECSEDFSWTSLWISGVNTYELWMEYIRTHYNSWTDTYGNYYWWGNNSWATYDELNVDCVNWGGIKASESISATCTATIGNEGFNKLWDLGYTGWLQWYFDNPCDASKWEYLPTLTDWWKLENIYGENDGNILRYFLIPSAGYIYPWNTIWKAQTLYFQKNIPYLWLWKDDNGIWYFDGFEASSVYQDLAVASPVRCFVVPENQRVTVTLVDWNEEETIITQKWKVIWEPEVNVAEWSFFMGWYDEDWNKFVFTDPINDDLVLHATWWKIEYNTWDITYTDTNGKVFSGIWTITITYGDKSITMLDRNLWAKSSGAWCVSGPEKFYNEPESNSCVSDYWYHFQWWNNYGFAMDENPEIWTGYADTSSNKWNNPYVSEIFGKDVDWNNYWWWDKTLNNSLWRWENEDNSDYMRQWPCPENYHVPSVEEWNKVLEYLANIRWYDLQYEDGLAYYWDEWMDLDPEVLEEFTRILGIPNAGYRDYNWFPEGFFDFLAEFWTSSPSNSKAAMLTLTQEYLDWFWTLATVGLNWAWDRSVGNSVRCFADNYEEWEEPLVLYYDTDEGSAIQAQSIPAGENGYLPGYTTHRNDDEKFLGWFNEDMTKEYTLSGNTFTNLIMSESLAEDGVVTVYAKWGHKVTFLDYDGTVLNVQAVLGGKSAVAPSDPSRNGYTFYGWDKDITNVTWDIEVIAQYTEKSSWENSGRHSGWWGWSSSNKVDNALVNEKDIESLSTNNTKMDAGDYTSIQLENDKQDSSDKNSVNNGGTKWNNFTLEFNEAYNYAKENWITTKPSIESANMYGNLTRIQMAKMLSNYAINVMWLKPDDSRVNKFKDVSDKLNAEYNNAVTLSYQLWIMWQNMPNNNFRPNDEVTRAEFVSAFSRMLYNTSDGEYRSTSKYYIHHMEKLEAEWIVTNTNPKMKEKRWYVMIMLMRSAK